MRFYVHLNNFNCYCYQEKNTTWPKQDDQFKKRVHCIIKGLVKPPTLKHEAGKLLSMCASNLSLKHCRLL